MEVDNFTPDGAFADNAIGPLPTFPVPVSYPVAATMALLPLQPPLYEAQVLHCAALRCPALPCFQGHGTVCSFSDKHHDQLYSLHQEPLTHLMLSSYAD